MALTVNRSAGGGLVLSGRSLFTRIFFLESYVIRCWVQQCQMSDEESCEHLECKGHVSLSLGAGLQHFPLLSPWDVYSVPKKPSVL